MEGCLAFALLLVAVPALVVAILARVRAKALQEEISGLRGAVDYLTRQVKDLRADIHEAPRSEDAPAAAQAAISSVGAPPVATPKPASPAPRAPTPKGVPEPAAARPPGDAAASPAPARATQAAGQAVRLGRSRRGQTLLRNCRRRTGPGRPLLPQVLGRARLAQPDDSRHNWPPHRHHPARRMRAPRRSRLQVHRERPPWRRHRHPLRHPLRHPRALASAPRDRGLPADVDRDGGGGHVVDPPRFGLHRPPRSAGRLLHSGPAFDRREQASPPILLLSYPPTRS